MPELGYNSPVGPLLISIHNQKVVGIKWVTVASSKKGAKKFQLDSFADETIKELDNYFSGKIDSLGIKMFHKLFFACHSSQGKSTSNSFA